MPALHLPTPRAGAPRKTCCSTCKLRDLCLPGGCSGADLRQLDGLVARRVSVPLGDTLFKAGDPFDALFAIRRGTFKTLVPQNHRRSRITGFHMAGELMGLDGIGCGRHACNAVALEDSQVCVIPYDRLESLSRTLPRLQRRFHRLLGSELAREYSVIRLLRNFRAKARLAGYLINLIRRLNERGPAHSSLTLKMTREDIGTYLGLRPETVSRCFSQLQREGTLRVDERSIRVRDRNALLAIGTVGTGAPEDRRSMA